MFSSCCAGSSSARASNYHKHRPTICKVTKAIDTFQAFFIHGRFCVRADKIIIDFCLNNEEKDVALRITGYYRRNILARNSRIRRRWCTEQRDVPSWFCLHNSTDFSFQIFFTTQSILIAFGEMHLASYDHHLPFERIRSVEVGGTVNGVTIERKEVFSYPFRRRDISQALHIRDRNLPTATVDALLPGAVLEEAGASGIQDFSLPFYGKFSQEYFKPGYSIIATGRVCPKPHMFKIAIQTGQSVYPHPDTAIQLVFRFIEKYDVEDEVTVIHAPVIYLNTYRRFKCISEVRAEMENGLKPGAAFHILIARNAESFRVLLDNDLVADYPYLLNLSHMDTCYIDGDIHLSEVVIEKD